jgi:Icc-related predicted phosphoesterase
MRVLVIAHINGRLDLFDRALERLDEDRPDAILIAGAVLGEEADAAGTFAGAYRRLEQAGVAAYGVPGEADAPERAYYAATVGQESAGRGRTTCVHGAFAPAPRNPYAVAGFGGRITDDERDHERSLRYPGWELLARLHLLRDIDQVPLLLFHHPPADASDVDLDAAGNHIGHPAVTEAITTWRPRVAACAGVRPGQGWLGRTLVVSPGRLDEGDYAVVDARRREAQPRRVPEESAAA